MGDNDDRMQRGFQLVEKMGFPQNKMLKQKEAYPDIYDMTIGHLFGEVWSRPHLSLRDRELITMASIIATGRPMGVGSHFRSAARAGITHEQIMELILHVGHYAGWPVISHAIIQYNEAMQAAEEEAKAAE